MSLHRLLGCCTLVLLALLVLPSPQIAADEEESAPVVKAEPLHIKVVTLKHRTPDELRSLLSQMVAAEAGGSPNVTLRAAVDPRTKTLFLRGTEAALKKADLLIKAIDVPGDRLAKLEVEGLLLFPLKHAKPGEVSTVLSQLGVANVRAMQLGETSVLVLAAKDDSAKQLGEVIDAVDRESATPPVAVTPAVSNVDE